MRMRKWTALMAGGAFLAQATACFGPDPQLFLTQSIINSLVANSISVLFNTLANLGGTAALLG